MKKSIIAFLSDFGLADEFVGVVKGVILSKNREAQIVDVTHSIPPHDIISGVLTIERSIKFFPPKTVFLVVIDPGVGGSRKPIAGVSYIDGKKFFFVGPDNGVLTPFIKNSRKIVILENSKYFLKSVSNTFHARDVFGPVAAYLSKGVQLHRFGRSISREKLVVLKLPKPNVSGNKICGQILHIDRFGNLITNIESKDKVKYIVFKRRRISLRKSYDEVDNFSPLVVPGSSSTLEISIREGSAERYFKAKRGDKVTAFKK